MADKKIKIAITGSIGSGKSTLTDFIIERGYTVIKADDISKEILATDSEVKKEVVKIFGIESFIGNEINRKYLSEKVFSNTENVMIIDSILHPLVIKKINELMREELKTRDKVFVEAALIYEAEMEDIFDYIVLVTADKEIRFQRKSVEMNRSNFEKRDANQIPDEEKKKRADFIFENNGGVEELKSKAHLLLALI